ncbi:hypothetical protein HYT74_04250 [Candidatus Daviesbacteria bacterium]|nr:hypothetical protein [Candidatus Daviesbacteria bacterium]
MSSTYLWVAVVIVLVISGFLFLGNQQTTQPEQTGVGGGPGILSQQKKIEVKLDPIALDQSGKAVLEDNNGKVAVTLTVSPVEGLNNQPAHIHLGSCPGVGEVLYPLNNVVDGSSVTEINTTLDQLKANPNPLAINVHKSDQEISVYTTCGELSK